MAFRFSLQGKEVRTWNFLLSTPTSTPQNQKYSTTKIKSSWLVDKASINIDIILLFQNLNLEIGLKPPPKLIWTSHQQATHIYFCIYQEEHWTWSGLWNCPAYYSMAIRIFSSAKTSEHEAVRSAHPPPPPKAEVFHNPSQDFKACRKSFPLYGQYTFVPLTWAWK